MIVMRDPKSKWYISKKERLSEAFPPYCSGSAFILSSDLVPDMLAQSTRKPFFWVDDYYITGSLTNDLPNIQRVNLIKMYHLAHAKLDANLVKNSPDRFVFHAKSMRKFIYAWTEILERHQGLKTLLLKANYNDDL